MKQAFIYNDLVRFYNRSRRKLHHLVVEGKNLRKQNILQKRIARLFKILTGFQQALKLGMTTAALSAGMLLFQPNAAQAQISFAAVQTNPFGLTDIGGVSAPAFADLDGDGDMDLMTGEDFGNFFYFQNTGTATAPVFATAQVNPFDLTAFDSFSKPVFADLDGDGDLDLMAGSGSGNFYYYQNTGTATAPVFAAAQMNPFGLIYLYEGLSAPAFADLDGDGDLDMMAGGAYGNFYYFQNIGTAAAPAFAAVQTNPFDLTGVEIFSTPTFADLDGDGDMDLMAGKLYGDLIYSQNTGTTSAPDFATAQFNPFGLTNVGFWAIPAFADLDGDGDMDLISGEYFGNFFYFQNNSICSDKTVFADADSDSYGDAASSLFVADCIVPAGYVIDSTDCNDGNANIHPSATEVCNDIDDNCNSQIDEGVKLTFYADADGDNFGDAATYVNECSAPEGYVSDNTDCDDNNAAINPNAIEIPNGLDDNCNGIIDDIVCVAPNNLSVGRITGTTAKLKWDAAIGAEGYKVRYKVSNTSAWTYGTTYNTSKPIGGLLPNTEYKWQVRTYCYITLAIASDWSSKQEFTTGPLRIGDEALQEVSFQIYPNPADDQTTIQFTLPQSLHVYISVYDVSGKEITTLFDGDVQQGDYSLQLNTNHFAKGVYLVKMISDSGIANQKLIVQ